MNLFLSKFCIYLIVTLILIKVIVMQMTDNYLVGDGIFAISANMPWQNWQNTNFSINSDL